MIPTLNEMISPITVHNDAGQVHCEDGPAIIYSNGTQSWVQNDRRHRTDGPAITRRNGNNSWWFGGVEYTFEDYTIAAGWTDDDIIEWKLKKCLKI